MLSERACGRVCVCAVNIYTLYTHQIYICILRILKRMVSFLCKEIRKLNLESASKNAFENVSIEANIRNSVDPETEQTIFVVN